jgi:acetylornithine deacetylase/succinyl-diaminopimelate desuccinylase-like protein
VTTITNMDWEALAQDAAQLLGAYLRQRTVNPPGNERLAADYLAGLLRARGFAPMLWEPSPGRANLTARLHGDGSKPGIILLHHMDVVAAEPDRWSVDPFGGEIRDGYVWGRGAIDMKGAGIMHLLAMDLLRREGLPLSRDIIFLAVSDEEVDSSNGVTWLLAEHSNDLQAEYVWDEGGFGLQGMFGSGVLFGVAVAEKGALWLRLVAEGEPGHGGIPRGANPAESLVAALERLRRHRWPVHLLPTVCDFFRAVGPLLPFPQNILLQHLDQGPVLALARSALLKEPALQAVLQSTVSLTGLRAGVKENVIPERAEATLDVRLLPGQDADAFIQELQSILAEPRVRVEVIQRPAPSTTTPYAGDAMYHVLERACTALVPGSRVAPLLTPGTTDSCHFRRRGYKTYGLFPAIITSEELRRFHGIDERISVQNLAFGTHLVYQVLRELCGK